jgi:hypothetical protein
MGKALPVKTSLTASIPWPNSLSNISRNGYGGYGVGPSYYTDINGKGVKLFAFSKPIRLFWGAKKAL